MGVCIGLMFDQDLPEATDAFDTDGKCVAVSLSRLDELCRAAGVRELSTFVDAGGFDISEEEMEDVPEEHRDGMSAVSSPEVEYCECTELMTTVSAILKQLESSSPEDFDPETAEAIVEGLKLMQTSLEIASREGAKCMLYLW
jgi:hypothetical protein